MNYRVRVHLAWLRVDGVDAMILNPNRDVECFRDVNGGATPSINGACTILGPEFNLI